MQLSTAGTVPVVSIAVLVAAILLRWLLDPVLGDAFPLVTLFGAVAATVWLCGYRAAVCVAILGYITCDYLFIPTRGEFDYRDVTNIVGLLAFLFSSGIIIWFGEAMRVAQFRYWTLAKQLSGEGPPEFKCFTSDVRPWKLNTSDLSVLGYCVTLAVLFLGGTLGYLNAGRLANYNQRVAQTHAVIDVLEVVLSTLKDAETGQRGFLLTEDDKYLEPYHGALEQLDQRFRELKELVKADPAQLSKVVNFQQTVEMRLGLLKQGINQIKLGNRPGALDIVRNNVGKKYMDQARHQVGEMQQAERSQLASRIERATMSYRATLLSVIVTTFLGMALVGMAFYLSWQNDYQQRQATIALAEQEERLRITLASIGDAVLTTDNDGRVQYLNPVAQTLTGWTTQEARGESLEVVFNIVNETTRDKVENPAVRALRDGKIVGLANHTILLAKDGHEYPIDDSAAPIRNASGGISGVVLVFRDITERKREEAAQAERSKLVALRADIGNFLSSSEPLLKVLQDCSDAILLHLEMAFAGVWIIPEGGDQLLLIASAGAFRDREGPHHRIPVGQFRLGQIASTKSPYLTNAVAEDTQFINQEWGKSQGMVAFAGYPLAVEERVIGVIAVFAKKPLSGDVLSDLDPIAESIAQYIDRKRTEQRILEQSELHRTTLASIGDAVITTDTQAQVTNLNSMAESLTGWTNGEALGKPLEVVFQILNEQTRQTVANPAVKALQEGVVVGLANHTTLISRDGAEHPIDDSAAPIRSRDGSILGCVLVFRDAAERRAAEEAIRHSEQQFRFVMDSMPQKIFTVTPSGEFEYFNPNWIEFTGLELPVIRGTGWAAIVHPEDLNDTMNAWGKALVSRDPFQLEHRFQRADGEFRWHITRARAWVNAEGIVQMWVGSSTEIHEQKNVSNELRELAAKLSEADRRKDEFLAILAHELRNPLAPIRNGLQIMRLSKGEGPYLDTARQMMERQLAQLVHLVDDLLDVSRISRGKLELRTERIPLLTILNNAVETSRPVIDSGGHELSVDFPQFPILVDADFTRLSQVFANLLNNAAKYSERGGHIHLKVELSGNQVLVRVSDTGIGIPTEMLPKIFEMFTQVDRSLERSQGGLGIGLTLVRRLVEMHGGSVEVSSSGLGQGSEFIVYLPIIQTPSGGKTPPAGEGNLASDENHQLRQRILIADDNADSAVSLSMLISLLGHEVRTVSNGLEAVVVAEQYRPQVILLDIGMPELNGYEACKQLRAQPWASETMIIALTGWGQEEDKRRSRESGFDHHLVKPVDPVTLERLLQKK